MSICTTSSWILWPLLSVWLSGSLLCTASHYRWTWHVVFGMCFAEMERRRYSGQDWEFWGCTRMFYCRWISSIVHSSFPGCLKTLLHTHSSPASQTHRWSVTTAGGTRWEINTLTTALVLMWFSYEKEKAYFTQWTTPTSFGFLSFSPLQVFSALMKDGLKEADKISSSNNSPALRS